MARQARERGLVARGASPLQHLGDPSQQIIRPNERLHVVFVRTEREPFHAIGHPSNRLVPPDPPQLVDGTDPVAERERRADRLGDEDFPFAHGVEQLVASSEVGGD